MLQEFEGVLRRLVGLRTPPKLALSISGGVDSMALASLASQWSRTRDVRLYGYIIDHHVRQGSSAEASVVADRLANLGIEPKILELHANLVESSVMEKYARDGRRELLQGECVKSGIHHILHGHTLDDQVELFIMRFLMRSTRYGLAGMHPESFLSIRTPPDQYPIRLLKPLLTFRKQQLENYCLENNVQWVEDPSNRDVTLTKRNAIRALLASPDLPPAFSPDNLIPFIAKLQEIRERTLSQAKLAYLQLRNAGDLYYKQGTFTLKAVKVYEALPTDVKEQLTLLILSMVSPLSVEQLFYRRQAIHNHVQLPLDRKRTLLDVSIFPTDGHLAFKRSRPRAQKSLEYSVYKATKDWSQWRLIDNRFWIRWKLPDTHERSDCNINARILYSTANSKATLSKIFGSDIKPSYERQTHPLFMFDDPSDPYTLRSDLIIGYPTLGYCRGLNMEWQPVKMVL